MIVGGNRDKVIKNIHDALDEGDFYKKVEVDDPDLSKEERLLRLSDYLRQKEYSLGFGICSITARALTWILTRALNIRTKIEGLDNLYQINGGAVITSNHFSPLDNMVVRKSMQKAFHQTLYIVSQDSNLYMKGFIGFLMKYNDIIPINESIRYMNDYFGPTIKDMLRDGKKILIYPEQEMWFNYRKPRPPKRGPYYYAAMNMVPVISCFVEIKTLHGKDITNDSFYRTRFTMHILPPIYPDPDKTVSQNSRNMMKIDYEQKKDAYEKAYGRPLTYDFEKGDIAGWIEEERDPQ